MPLFLFLLFSGACVPMLKGEEVELIEPLGVRFELFCDDDDLFPEVVGESLKFYLKQGDNILPLSKRGNMAEGKVINQGEYRLYINSFCWELSEKEFLIDEDYIVNNSFYRNVKMLKIRDRDALFLESVVSLGAVIYDSSLSSEDFTNISSKPNILCQIKNEGVLLFDQVDINNPKVKKIKKKSKGKEKLEERVAISNECGIKSELCNDEGLSDTFKSGLLQILVKTIYSEGKKEKNIVDGITGYLFPKEIKNKDIELLIKALELALK